MCIYGDYLIPAYVMRISQAFDFQGVGDLYIYMLYKGWCCFVDSVVAHQ